MICFKTSSAQIGRQYATDTVINHLLADDTGKVNIFARISILGNDDTLYLRDGYILNPYNTSWVFFIDDHPTANWFHNCRYLIMNEMDGLYQLIDKRIYPDSLQDDFELLSEINLPETPEIFNPPGNSTDPSDPNPYLHAVIICGDEMFPRYWQNTSYIFTTLKQKGFTDENIILHYNNGNTNFPAMGTNFDHDQEFLNDIDYPAYKKSIESTFKAFAGQSGGNPSIPQLQPYDHLFVFTTNHGDLENGHASIRILKEIDQRGLDHLYDHELASLLEDINCAQIAIVMSQCHSGGFIDDVMDYTNYSPSCRNRVINTACETDESSWYEWWMSEKMYDEYILYWIAAACGMFPDNFNVPWLPTILIENFDFLQYFLNHPMNYYPDANDDKILQLFEVHEYADNFDCFSEYGFLKNDLGGINPIETPQCAAFPIGDLTSNLDRVLAIDGIKGRITGETGFTLEGNCLVTGDLVVTTNSTLNISSNSNLFIFGDAGIIVEEGASLVVGDNAAITSFSENVTIDVSGSLQVGSNVQFLAEEGADIRLVVNNASLNTSIAGAVFERGFIESAQAQLSLTDCSFAGAGGIDFSHGNLTLDNCTFDNCCVYASQPSGDNSSVTVQNGCTFTNAQSALHITAYPVYTIENSTFYNCGNAIALYSLTGSGNTKSVYGNHISGCTNGIVVYNSSAIVSMNQVYENAYGIKSLNHSQVSLEGNQYATPPQGTQQIRDNTYREVYATEGSFPYKFTYNAVYDDASGLPLVTYTGEDSPLDVRHNYWGSTFNPQNDLEPYSSYIYIPAWEPGGGMEEGDGLLFAEATDNLMQGNYTAAKNLYMQVTEQYPQGLYAEASLKALLPLEKLAGNDYAELKGYYTTNAAVQAEPSLALLGDFLGNYCDIRLENWPDAIAWFENIIQDPPSFEDSLFAIIDLGYTYLLMQQGGYKSSYTGSMPWYKPVSKKAHEENRDYLLSLLGEGKKAVETQESGAGASNIATLGKNIPNPFTGETVISYELEEPADITFLLSDQAGRLIHGYPAGRKEKGPHSFTLDSSGLKPGIYILSLQVNGTVAGVRKIIVIK